MPNKSKEKEKEQQQQQPQPQQPDAESQVVIFREWDLINGEKYRVYRDSYNGHEYFSIRRFYVDRAGVLNPGKGVTFADEDIEEIRAGLDTMEKWIGEQKK